MCEEYRSCFCYYNIFYFILKLFRRCDIFCLFVCFCFFSSFYSNFSECSELRADIFFVLDESSSIRTEANFKKELTLVAELIDQVDVGETKVQIGVLTFSSRPRMQFHLDKYHTKIELINALAKVRWHGRDTYTNEAIDMLINKGLNQNYGARNGVPQIAVFVTDGRSTRPRLTALAVKVLKETDIISFAIGM